MTVRQVVELSSGARTMCAGYTADVVKEACALCNARET